MDRDNAAFQKQVLTPEQLEAILRFNTCTISDAIECFGVRLCNEGFTHPGIGPVTGPDERTLGYAVTVRVKSSNPPATGGRFAEHNDWWSTLERLPRPRIMVFEEQNGDAEEGSCIGEVHGAILKALGCDAVITNGAVRDVPGLRKLGLPVFAKSVTVSQSFMHILEFGAPVEIFGLIVHQGDLLYADYHGVLAIPMEIAAELPAAAERISQKDRTIIELCQSPDFSTDKLIKTLKEHEQCK
jgi:regulator of RNase E activity RraA